MTDNMINEIKRIAFIVGIFLVLFASISVVSAYDCEVYDERVDQIIYYGNNNELMWNQYGGGFTERHILCYNGEWYEGGPTWDWHPFNGNFIPAENVVSVGTQIGDWTMSESNGIWIKDLSTDTCKFEKTITLDADDEDYVAQAGIIRTQGAESFNSNPVVLSQNSISQLVNPINLDKGNYKIVIKDGAWSRWDNDIGNSDEWGGAEGLAWESLASVVYNDKDGGLTISRFGVSYTLSENFAQNAGEGKGSSFDHNGGNIYLFLDDTPIDDNRGSMTLGLYKCDSDNEDELDCNDLDFNCDEKVNSEDKEIAVDLYLELFEQSKDIDREIIDDIRNDYNCDNFAEYLENNWLGNDFLFNEIQVLSNRIDELDGDMCPVDDDDDNDRDRSPRFGYGDMCEENWVFSDWTSCDGLLSQSRSGVDTNACNPYESEIFEVRACDVPSIEESVVVKKTPNPFNWLIILLIALAVVIFLIILAIIFK